MIPAIRAIGNAPEWHEGTRAGLSLVRGPAILEPGAHFNTLSLGNWLTLAAEAGVPAVPAEHLGSLTPRNMMDIEEAMYDGAEGLDLSAFNAINARLTDLRGAFMVRCDAVSSGDVKALMGSPVPPGKTRLDLIGPKRGFGYQEHDGRRFLSVDDSRFSDGVGDWPDGTCPIWARPIVPARQIDGPNGPFQAEWRIFVKNGQISGASSYYPQAPRPVDDADRTALMAALVHARKIVDLLVERSLVPDHPIYRSYAKIFDPASIACSIDFIELDDGQVLLLEGGPASLPKWGSHGCCFADEGQEEREPVGIAWGGGRFDPPEVLEALLVEVRARASHDFEDLTP